MNCQYCKSIFYRVCLFPIQWDMIIQDYIYWVEAIYWAWGIWIGTYKPVILNILEKPKLWNCSILLPISNRQIYLWIWELFSSLHCLSLLDYWCNLLGELFLIQYRQTLALQVLTWGLVWATSISWLKWVICCIAMQYSALEDHREQGGFITYAFHATLNCILILYGVVHNSVQ